MSAGAGVRLPIASVLNSPNCFAPCTPPRPLNQTHSFHLRHLPRLYPYPAPRWASPVLSPSYLLVQARPACAPPRSLVGESCSCKFCTPHLSSMARWCTPATLCAVTCKDGGMLHTPHLVRPTGWVIPTAPPHITPRAPTSGHAPGVAQRGMGQCCGGGPRGARWQSCKVAEQSGGLRREGEGKESRGYGWAKAPNEVAR